MNNLNRLQQVLYNDGERLLPGVTHSLEELVRHVSSYEFFVAACEADLKQSGAYGQSPLTIVDLGFGTGHGCQRLAQIPNSRIIGIDNSPACRRYALRHYNAPNIEYVVADIPEYISQMSSVDYVVSRGVIEHVQNGIGELFKVKQKSRLMADLPYNEPSGINQHHVVSAVTANSFREFQNFEIYYEEVSGEIYTGQIRDTAPNMIMCVSSQDGMPALSTMLELPIRPWHSEIAYGSLAPESHIGHRVIDYLWPPGK